ncbi:hypothetical protein [Helicobacter cynogastricus]|uniref:hypothetical protein n=1 Tax=Helicobacter cynogastricus TaxID=329937 RepID=UPI000CF0C466|nr:hypothetical protein [Helicobacter cynogastricus]
MQKLDFSFLKQDSQLFILIGYFNVAKLIYLTLVGPSVLGILSLYPIFKIYKRRAPSEVWAWRCVISGVFNALAVVLWYVLFI